MSVSAPAAAPPAPSPSGQGSASATPASQSPAGGQGSGGQATQPGGQQQGGFNWGLFPDVPEGQRELLQPHLTNVLGHVTRMEQQYAPYKDLMGAVQPDQVSNLMQFLQNYSQDPLSTWLGLAQALQEEGHIQNPEFSLESLQGMLSAPQAPSMPGAEDMPPWAQQMAQQLETMTQAEQARQQQEAQRQAEQEAMMQEQMLTEAKATIREQLKSAGIPTDGLITDEQLVAGLIAHNGDINQVVQSYSGLRDGFLKGFTDANGQGTRQPTINGGPPQAPKGSPRPRSGDGFRQASIGAAQMLAQSSAAGAQE